MKEKKKIVPIIAFIVLIIAIVGVALQPNFTQIGDNVVSDRYYDTAYEAYEHNSGAVNIKEDITTVNINNKYAVWFAVSDENELATLKMAVKDGKYFSLGDTCLYSEKNLNNSSNNIPSSLEDEMTLDKEMLEYEILREEKYKKSPLAKKNYHTEYFTYNNKDYVFVYEVVPGQD
ncbi:MAG: hypothetical protein SO152_00720 [Ruminococcus sp.]|nr:hypothetical protein [Ruminococcus sp.]